MALADGCRTGALPSCLPDEAAERLYLRAQPLPEPQLGILVRDVGHHLREPFGSDAVAVGPSHVV